MHKSPQKIHPSWKLYTVTKNTSFQGVDTIMISNVVIKHALSSEIDPLLQALFQYIDQLSLPETPYVTGRSPISKKSLLKCFFLKTYFSIDSLRQLVNTLDRFGYFRRICGLHEVPHLSTFSRARKWFREQGFSVFNAQLLKDLGVRCPKVVIIDSTALRSRFYDSQTRWRISTRYKWFKRYKLHLRLGKESSSLMLSQQRINMMRPLYLSYFHFKEMED
jgi:hypothetical protein